MPTKTLAGQTTDQKLGFDEDLGENLIPDFPDAIDIFNQKQAKIQGVEELIAGLIGSYYGGPVGKFLGKFGAKSNALGRDRIMKIPTGKFGGGTEDNF